LWGGVGLRHCRKPTPPTVKLSKVPVILSEAKNLIALVGL